MANLIAITPEAKELLDWTMDYLLTQLNLDRVIDKEVIEEARAAMRLLNEADAAKLAETGGVRVQDQEEVSDAEAEVANEPEQA